MNKAMLLKKYMFNNKKKSGRLPSAYQEVEYIESTGTQYIDSGLDCSSGMRSIVDAIFTNKGTTYYNSLIGTQISASPWNAYYIRYAKADVALEYEGRSVNRPSITIGERYYIDYELTTQYIKLIINNNTIENRELSSTINITTNSLYLLGMNNGGSVTKTFARVYSAKFINTNGVLVRDFIPCYRKSDNEIGLYDIVNNQFYTNAGSGTFLCGRPLVYDTISGYEQLDYIESSGTQYIDTGIYQNSSARKYIIEMSLNTIDTPNYIIRAEHNYIGEVFQSADADYYIGYCGSETGTSGAVANERNMFECYFSNGNQYVKKNGTTILTMSKSYRSTDIGEIKVFKGSSSVTNGKAKMYNLRLYVSNNIVRNFIPMRKISTNELGLYDLVNGVFYTNQGSGSFVAGEVLKA